MALQELSRDRYELNLVQIAVTGPPKEDILYAVFTEFVLSHKVPSSRFVLYPQVDLKWKPEDDDDQRSEVPDFGIGHFTLTGAFKLRCGVEAKRAIGLMANLPAPRELINNREVRMAFRLIRFQAEDQAKAAYKNKCPLREDGIDWILLVGPYWTPQKFGPFTEAEISVRAMKLSDSGDYGETMKVMAAMEKPYKLRELYTLNSVESVRRLGSIFGSTDQVAQPYINAMSRGK